MKQELQETEKKVKILNKVNKAYRFRLYPSEEQKVLFAKTFGCVRFVYNKMLAERIEIYQKYKDDKAQLKKQKLPTPAKYKKDFEWLKEVDSLALANAQLNLQKAYSNFFRDKSIGFIKFKSKRKSKDSYTTNNVNDNIEIKGNKIKLPKLGLVNIVLHRQIPDNQIIKSCTISKTHSGKYYISILVEFERYIQPAVLMQQNVLGLDMDMQELYTDSQGIRAEYPRFYRKALKKLQKQQRKLSKMQKGSKNRNRQRIKVARLHEKVANCRKDFLHKQSRKLADSYDAVAIEDLNMKAMSQCLHFGKSVSDIAWGMFTNLLKYKLEDLGKQLIKVNKWFPSSKTCNNCGYVNHELQLSDRQWICPSCRTIIDRDWNAAKNIRDEAIRIMRINETTAGTAGIAC